MSLSDFYIIRIINWRRYWYVFINIMQFFILEKSQSGRRVIQLPLWLLLILTFQVSLQKRKEEREKTRFVDSSSVSRLWRELSRTLRWGCLAGFQVPTIKPNGKTFLFIFSVVFSLHETSKAENVAQVLLYVRPTHFTFTLENGRLATSHAFHVYLCHDIHYAPSSIRQHLLPEPA